MTTALESAIRAQPESLQRIVELDITDAVQKVATWQRLWLIGTGTSQHAAELGARMFRQAGVDAHAIPAMHFAIEEPPLRAGDAAIIITHTAQTAFALASRARAAAEGLSTLSISRKDGPLPDAIGTVLKEQSETYTVSYTTTLLLLARLAASLGAKSWSDEVIGGVPHAVRIALDTPGTEDIPIPKRLLVLSGVGAASVTAREGALKVREAARFPAEGYDAEYLLHGSAVPLNASDQLLLLEPPDDGAGFLDSLGRAAQGSGIPVSRVRENADLPNLLAQIPLTVRLQLLALRIATKRGQDPDTVITGAWDDEKLWTIGTPPRG
ncbi:MAG: SIS domain-containing protein [Actinomycetota bacterium]